MSTPLSDKHTLQQEREKLHVMLLSSVSHDLKTPLACVIGSLEIYQQLKDTLSQEHKDALITTAIEEARRLDSFITNILDMSKLESALPFKREVTDIGQLVRQCVLKAEPTLRAHEMELALPAGILAEVNVAWISRAVMLLLDNAVRYTPETTTINISVSGTDTCKITVADNGPGISKKTKAGIFQKHTRTARQDAKIAGTGLGLPICKAIADAHGGTITLTSAKEGGAIFTITLPASTKKEARLQGPLLA